MTKKVVRKLKDVRALIALHDPSIIVEHRWGDGWVISYPFNHDIKLPPGFCDKGIGIGPDYNRHRDLCYMYEL